MTITDNRKNPTAYFQMIKKGETFYSPDTECFYMRIEEIYLEEDDVQYNAVDLSEGCLVYFNEDEEVEKVRANMTITNP